jgi:HD-GYP domain-containing protein (c-di-GMP phosphodiesterase class II)/HAMP domain-containing protein
MKLARFRPDRAFLENKVGRRIFLVFMICAILPLGLMALVSYFEVTSQLSRQADERLHQACRSAGMTLMERLALLESDLDMIGALWRQGAPEAVALQHSAVHERVSARFQWVSLQAEDGRILARNDPEARSFLPALNEWKHLAGNNSLVAARKAPGGSCEIILARPAFSDGPEKKILVGEINQDYLWGGEGFLPALTEIAVLDDESREVLFSSLTGNIPVRDLARAMTTTNADGRFAWAAAGAWYEARYWVLFMQPTYWSNWIIVVNEKRDSVLEPLRSFRIIFPAIILLTICIVAFFSLREIRRSTGPIEQLRNATQKIAAKDFSARVKIRTRDEFEELGLSFNNMAERLGAHVETMETVNTIGKSLTAEKNEGALLGLILDGAKRLTNADGGALCLLSGQGRLILALLEIDSLGLRIRNEAGPAAEAWLSLAGSRPGGESAALDDVIRRCQDTYAAAGDGFRVLHEFDRKHGYRTQSWISVPLKNHENEVIGTLQLFNSRERRDGSAVDFSDDSARMAESLGSQAAVVLTKNRLVDEFKKLFEGLTELIATAVDAKSPSTGDHCKRVPALTMMIAEAACKTAEGPLRDFALSEEELYELRIAAQLHDCGKVATPVHVMDKATKLETILDRIQLIDTRFEILRRDRRIALLEDKLQAIDLPGPATWTAEIDAAMDRFTQQLQQDMEFLHICNRGTEAMPVDWIRRVKEIAAEYYWSGTNEVPSSVLTPDEVLNLTIERGTLNAEERLVIQKHASLTHQMLETLPYPRMLRNVPMHAASHHERMDGKGYPFGLDRSRLSMQGRIIAIADVFEALTAKDRAYKPGKPLSEALKILRNMKESGHIDPDLYDLFIREKIYLRYALENLESGQIDAAAFSDEPVASGASRMALG